MRKIVLLALAVAAAVGLVACGSSSSTALTGKNWQLTAITEKVPAFQGVIPPADQSKYVITFNTDDTWNGTADCNQIAGTYKTSGSSGLTITPGISTMAMCPDGSFDALFVHGLSRATSYAIANDTLTITLNDEGTMTFVVGVANGTTPEPTAEASSAAASATAKPTAKPTASPTAKPTPTPTPKPTATPASSAKPTAGATAKPTPTPTPKPTPAPTAKPTATPPPSASGLIGRTWQLTSITQKVPAFQANVPAADQSKYTIEFLADGSFSATADCNTVTGQYATSNPNATSGDLALTLGAGTIAMCPDGSYSDLYILAISGSQSYAIANSQLTITLEDQGTLSYK